jgi:hypothetical protein
VDEGGGDRPHREAGGQQVLPELGEAKIGEGGCAAEDQHGRKNDVSQQPRRVKGPERHGAGHMAGSRRKAVDDLRGVRGMSSFIAREDPFSANPNAQP